MSTLMDNFRQRHPGVVTQMELMLTELERITVLSNELWHVTLTEVQVVCCRPIYQLAPYPHAAL